MAQVQRIPLSLIRGEDARFEVVVTEAGSTVILSGYGDLQWTLRASPGASVLIQKSLSAGVSITPSQDVSTNRGRARITLDSADTSGLSAGIYYYDLLGVDSGGLKDNLILPSKFNIEQGITE